MWRAFLVLLVLVGGCDLVFGIEAKRIVEVEVVRRTIENDASGASASIDTPMARADVEVRVFDEDGTPLTVGGDGATFTFAADGKYRFVITDLVVVETSEYQGNTDHMRVVRISPGRADRQFGQATAALVVDMRPGPPPAGGVVRIHTTGVYNQLAPTMSMPPLFAVSFTGLPLVDTAKNDRMYVVHFGTQTVNGETVFVTDAAFTPPAVQMSPTDNTIVVGPARAIGGEHCGRVVVPRFSELERLRAAWGRSAQLEIAVWQIGADTPRSDLAGYLPLAACSTVGNKSTNDDFTVTYGDPYPNPEHIVLLTTQVYTTLLSRGISIQTGIESRMVAPLAPNCLPTDVSSQLALPDTIAVGGTAIVDDDQRIRLDRSATIPIDFTFAGGDRGAFAVRMYKVTPSPTVPLQPGTTMFTTEPRVQLDEAELDTGATYTVLVYNLLGIEHATDGDFGPDGYAQYTSRFSRTFTVEN